MKHDPVSGFEIDDGKEHWAIAIIPKRQLSPLKILPGNM